MLKKILILKALLICNASFCSESANCSDGSLESINRTAQQLKKAYDTTLTIVSVVNQVRSVSAYKDGAEALSRQTQSIYLDILALDEENDLLAQECFNELSSIEQLRQKRLLLLNNRKVS